MLKELQNEAQCPGGRGRCVIGGGKSALGAVIDPWSRIHHMVQNFSAFCFFGRLAGQGSEGSHSSDVLGRKPQWDLSPCHDTTEFRVRVALQISVYKVCIA